MLHFLDILDHDAAMLRRVLDASVTLRNQRRAGTANPPALRGKTLAMIFQKPSLRTRVSFEQAVVDLGGHAMVLGQNEIGLGQRESVADVARVLGGMVHGIAARVFNHAQLIELAAHSPVPVINMLSDAAHPCQALADVLTMMDEFGPDLKGRRLVFVGDGNNVAKSLAKLCGRLGIAFVLAAPAGYAFEDAFCNTLMAAEPGMDLEITHHPAQAVRYADAVYADTFVSMGQEDEREHRLQVFRGFQINDALLAHAPDHAIVLHCLPAYRGVEITDSAMDGPRSRVFPQAHNRLHAQKGLLVHLMGA